MSKRKKKEENAALVSGGRPLGERGRRLKGETGREAGEGRGKAEGEAAAPDTSERRGQAAGSPVHYDPQLASLLAPLGGGGGP